MTPTQSFVLAILTAILTSSAWPVFGPRIVEWKNRKKNAAKAEEREDEARQEREHDEWMHESKKAYERVSKECGDCHRQLEKLKREHRIELDEVKRELGDVKDALLDSIQALDDVLPHITTLPEATVAELRKKNRARRQAAFRGRP